MSDLAGEDAWALCVRAFAGDLALIDEASDLLTTLFAAAYGTEVVRHYTATPPGSSEVLWALLDPDAARTNRFIDHVNEIDPLFAGLVDCADQHTLAALLDPLDDHLLFELHGLWIHAAVAGHGSGLWIPALLVQPDVTAAESANAGLALAVTGYAALDLALPDELAHLGDAARSLAADVRATAMRRAS